MKTLALIFLLLPGMVFADICRLATGASALSSTFYGSTNCGEGAIDSITVIGDLDVLGTVINTATVKGEVDANGATIRTLNLSGVLHASISHFGTINAGNNVYLDDSTAQSIVVTASPAVGIPKVYLNDQTAVGNITFQGTNDGLVIVEQGSASVQGTVSGGSIQYQTTYY